MWYIASMTAKKRKGNRGPGGPPEVPGQPRTRCLRVMVSEATYAAIVRLAPSRGVSQWAHEALMGRLKRARGKKRG